MHSLLAKGVLRMVWVIFSCIFIQASGRWKLQRCPFLQDCKDWSCSGKGSWICSGCGGLHLLWRPDLCGSDSPANVRECFSWKETILCTRGLLTQLSELNTTGHQLLTEIEALLWLMKVSPYVPNFYEAIFKQFISITPVINYNADWNGSSRRNYSKNAFPADTLQFWIRWS